MLLWRHMLADSLLASSSRSSRLRLVAVSHTIRICCCVAASPASLSDAGEVAVLVVNGTQLVQEVSSSSSSTVLCN
jgi:hypothetical protein